MVVAGGICGHLFWARFLGEDLRRAARHVVSIISADQRKLPAPGSQKLLVNAFALCLETSQYKDVHVKLRLYQVCAGPPPHFFLRSRGCSAEAAGPNCWQPKVVSEFFREKGEGGHVTRESWVPPLSELGL